MMITLKNPNRLRDIRVNMKKLSGATVALLRAAGAVTDDSSALNFCLTQYRDTELTEALLQTEPVLLSGDWMVELDGDLHPTPMTLQDLELFLMTYNIETNITPAENGFSSVYFKSATPFRHVIRLTKIKDSKMTVDAGNKTVSAKDSYIDFYVGGLPEENEPSGISCEGAIEHVDLALYIDMEKASSMAPEELMGLVQTYEVKVNGEVVNFNEENDYLQQLETTPNSSEMGENYMTMVSTRLQNISNQELRLTVDASKSKGVILNTLYGDNPTLLNSETNDFSQACLSAVTLPICTPSVVEINNTPLGVSAAGVTNPSIKVSVDNSEPVRIFGTDLIDLENMSPLKALVMSLQQDLSMTGTPERNLLDALESGFDFVPSTATKITGHATRTALSKGVVIKFYRDSLTDDNVRLDLFSKLFPDDVDEVILTSCHSYSGTMSEILEIGDLLVPGEWVDHEVNLELGRNHPELTYFQYDYSSPDQPLKSTIFTLQALLDGKVADFGQYGVNYVDNTLSFKINSNVQTIAHTMYVTATHPINSTVIPIYL